MSRAIAGSRVELTVRADRAAKNRGLRSVRAVVFALLRGHRMDLRAAITPEPDYPFVRRVALFAGVLTAGVIASTIAVVLHSRHEAREMPIPTILIGKADLQGFASFRVALPEAPPDAMQLAITELEAYARIANGGCPQDLLRLNQAMPALHAIDPWGNPYQVACNTGSVAFRSAGPDRVHDTADDLWR